jgi:hypothetical protein
MLAAAKGQPGAVRSLLRGKADARRRGRYSDTALTALADGICLWEHSAASQPRAEKDRIEVASLLLGAGAAPREANPSCPDLERIMAHARRRGPSAQDGD